MKVIRSPVKLIVTIIVAFMLAVLALYWHSVNILPEIIKQVGEEQSSD